MVLTEILEDNLINMVLVMLPNKGSAKINLDEFGQERKKFGKVASHMDLLCWACNLGHRCFIVGILQLQLSPTRRHHSTCLLKADFAYFYRSLYLNKSVSEEK